MPGSMMLARRIKDAVIPATTGTMATYPTGATNGIQLTSDGSSAGTFGSYVEVVAADTITSEFRITGVMVDSFSAATRVHITVATGASSSEVAIGTFCVGVGATATAPMVNVSMPNIPANTRVAMKCSVQSGTGVTCRVAINYVTV